MEKIYKVEITPKTIILILTILFSVWLLITLHGLVLLIFIAFSIAATLSPLIEYLNKKSIPKNVSIIGIYFLFLACFILLILLIYKPLILQLQDFIRNFPDIFVNVINSVIDKIPIIKEQFNWDEIFKNIKDSFWEKQQIANISSQLISGIGKAFGIVGSTFNGLVNLLTTIMLSMYFIQFKEDSKEKLLKLVPVKHHKRIIKFMNTIEKQLGTWLRAQIILMLIIGTLSFIGFEIVGSNFSIPMGIIAGLLESVPGIGPIITWILAMIVVIGSNMPTWKIVFITIWFILIQQLENYFIVPKIMEKIVGINPILTLIAILGATRILGIWGALLAVPLVAIIQISLRYYLEYKKEYPSNKM